MLNPHRRPRIGIFDSGVGGLTVARAVKKACPGADLLYVGDTARVPYGSKSPATIQRYTGQILNFLFKKKVDLIVAACNTASALGLPAHRARVPVPMVDVIGPACRALSQKLLKGKVAVLATKSTVRSGAYKKAVRSLHKRLSVKEVACPLLVPLVEEGHTRGPLVRKVLSLYLKTAGKAQALVLGCTHYPLLKAEIRSLAGPRVLILDSAVETARQVREHLGAKGRGGRIECYVTDEPAAFKREALQLTGLKLNRVLKVDLERYPEVLR